MENNNNSNQRSLREKLLDRHLWMCFTAEFFGTCVFVFTVCGATFTSTRSPNPVYVFQIALTVGLSVATLTSSLGHISGGQFNPVVTIGLMVSRRIRLLNGLVIIGAQFLGGILGASFLYGLTVSEKSTSFGVTMPSSNINLGQAVGIEAFLTFLLVFTIHSVTDPKKSQGCSEYGAPIIIGFCVCICHMIGIPFTGCSLNPARSFAPALINNSWKHHWVYWIGPILGAIPGALLYEKVFSVNKNEVSPAAASKREEDHNL
ncbi:aquaporin-like [Actinia tenebrosa]|uniref:Aquaporin-like n=1 Tax=Actinia tenebrosa TaxID=6105 RepID=A0A6P8H6L3_ACTTE|nr:aquaporin-like [Actinia tenebrosa]